MTTSAPPVVAALTTGALTRFRVLVCVARADPALTIAERTALEDALEGLELLAGAAPKDRQRDRLELGAQVRLFTTSESRTELHRSVTEMVLVDGVCSPAEQRLLDRLSRTLEIAETTPSVPRRIAARLADMLLPGRIRPVNDPLRRSTAVRSDILKYSLLCGVLGAVTIPVAPLAIDLAVVAVQAKLVRDIGRRWGHRSDGPAVATMLGALAIGTGARFAAAGIAALLPVLGNLVAGAVSFASTWALGRIVDRYFATVSAAHLAGLRSAFNERRAVGQKEHDAHEAQASSEARLGEMALQTLRAALRAGRITDTEYAARIRELDRGP